VSTLGRWLAGILNAHIERHNVVADDEHVTAELTIDTTHFDRALRVALAGTEAALTPVGTAARQIADALVVTATDRPCWACGDPRGFHAPHRPCWNVPPFTRNADQAPRTYGAGGLL
jgi:hypothetical protein